MTRDEQQRHLDALDAELAEMCETVREIRRDRDLTKTWLEGYDIGYDAGYDERDAEPEGPTPALLRGAALLATLSTPAPLPEPLGAREQDGAPPAEYDINSEEMKRRRRIEPESAQ